MNMTAILVRVCLAVAFAITTSASAQTEKKPGSAGAPVQGGTEASPPRSGKATVPASPGRASGGMTVAPLTSKECKDLGGVVTDSHNYCPGQQVCTTVDQSGTAHFVCIAKAQ